MPTQKRLDRVYINIAENVSVLSHCERKKVGCIIVKGNNILSMGYNGTPTGMDNKCEDEVLSLDDKFSTCWYVLHAESNAIAKVANSTNDCFGSTLYTTMSPCRECAKLIIQAGIQRVVHKELYRDCLAGETLQAMHLLEDCNIEVLKIKFSLYKLNTNK